MMPRKKESIHVGFKVGCPRIAGIQSDEKGRQWVNFSTASYPTLPCDGAPFNSKFPKTAQKMASFDILTLKQP